MGASAGCRGILTESSTGVPELSETGEMDEAEVDRHFEKVVGLIWRELRGGLWHSTGSHRFRWIAEAGEIQPTPALPPGEVRWAAAATTFSRSNGAVSLFDFEDADWPWLFEKGKEHYWPPFLAAPELVTDSTRWIATVWIEVDKSIAPALMSLKETKDVWHANLHRLAAGGVHAEHENNTIWMPRLEALHTGPIPLAACKRAIAVCAVDPRAYQDLGPFPVNLDRLSELERAWQTEFAESYRIRSLPMGEKLKHMLLESAKTVPASEDGRDLAEEL